MIGKSQVVQKNGNIFYAFIILFDNNKIFLILHEIINLNLVNILLYCYLTARF